MRRALSQSKEKISPHPPPPIDSLASAHRSEIMTSGWWEGDRVVGKSFPIRPKIRPAGLRSSQAATTNAGAGIV